MSTLKQTEANRRNAQKSTGPRTESGKSQSRLNALKTGIDAKLSVLPGESPDSFDSLAAEYYHRHTPATPEQRALVDVLIHNEWLLRRLRRVEHEVWDAQFKDVAENEYLDKDRPFKEAYERRMPTFHRLQRRIDSTFRQYTQALRALRQLQPAPPGLPEPDTEIGFVPIPVAIPVKGPVPIPAHRPEAEPASPTPIGFVPPLTETPPVSGCANRHQPDYNSISESQ